MRTYFRVEPASTRQPETFFFCTKQKKRQGFRKQSLLQVPFQYEDVKIGVEEQWSLFTTTNFVNSTYLVSAVTTLLGKVRASYSLQFAVDKAFQFKSYIKIFANDQHQKTCCRSNDVTLSFPFARMPVDTLCLGKVVLSQICNTNRLMRLHR